MKRLLILGATGTIGINTLKVVERFPDRFEVVGLTANNSIDVLSEQTRRFRPKYVGVSGSRKKELSDLLSGIDVRVFDTQEEICEICSLKEIDIVVIGISGRPALEPFLAAVRAGKIVAPANKEALVIAGDLLMQEAQAHGARIIPVDSEQSAIFQCLEGQSRKDLKKVYLTASGGALRDTPMEQFDELTVEQILDHPRWKMGQKITVDSATMMNKGFEIIEAQRLFDLRLDQIEVVVHPEAIIHSMVCFRDGSIIAQLGVTDMRIPIQYALTYPERWSSSLPDLDLFETGQLNFERPDVKKFPALTLTRDVAREGGTLPGVLNAADEIAVQAFLDKKILFRDIYSVVETVVQKHQREEGPDLQSILRADQWAREKALEEISALR